MKFGKVIRLADHETGCMRPGWRIKAEPDVMVRLRRIFPRTVSSRQEGIVVLDTPELAHEIRWVLERWPMEISDGDRRHLAKRARSYAQRANEVESILNGEHLAIANDVAEARDYQRQAADVVLKTGRLLCIDELGLGKTLTGLLIFREPAALPGLVVCPVHLQRQWLAELRRWMPWLQGHIIRSTTVYDPAERRGVDGDPDVLISSYSKLHGWADHLAGKVKGIVFDEAHELRRIGTSDENRSLKYDAASRIAALAAYRMGLTATPVFNYGQEAYNLISVLDPEALGTRVEFRNEWGGAEEKVADPKALGYYLRRERIVLRRTRKDVGRELPEVIRVPHEIDANPEAVDEMNSNAHRLAEAIVNDEGPSDERYKIYAEFDAQLRHDTGVAKAPFVADFVRMLVESDEKVLLFGWHHRVYDVWRSALHDLDPVFYTGAQSDAQKAGAKLSFLDGDSKILVMSLRSGAGLDGLQAAANVCVFGELDWSPAMHDQCIGRLHRDGQAGNVIAYFLHCDAGADPKMIETLEFKRQQGEPIRDPDLELLGTAPDAGNRIKQLAEDYLARTAVAA